MQLSPWQDNISRSGNFMFAPPRGAEEFTDGNSLMTGNLVMDQGAVDQGAMIARMKPRVRPDQ
jgi:hypothetical protein